MRATLAVMLMLCLALLAGCSNRKYEAEDKLSDPMTLRVVIVAEEEHLGHNIDESGRHSVWCDGLRARLLPSNEDFMIYSINNPFSNSPHRLEKGHGYRIHFSGELGTGVMAYNGKCISLDQISEAVSIDDSPDEED